MRAHPDRAWSPFLVLAALGSACCGASTGETPPPLVPEPPAARVAAVTYDVHEWGLVRGTMDDRVMLSGPHAEPVPMPVAKPVLYFHREGEGALQLDVEVEIPDGHVVEHWPFTGAARGSTRVRWTDVLVQAGACAGSSYPTLAMAPCSALTDGCESAELREVETADSDCLYWPRPPDDDGPTQAWAHLFYRGEVRGAPRLPLRFVPQADGSLNVTHMGDTPIPGSIIRVSRGHAAEGIPDGVVVSAPPTPGASMVIGAPSAAVSAGADALSESLRAAGLTSDEITAFRRAWDRSMFGADLLATADVAAASPMAVTTPVMPPWWRIRAVLYVLPLDDADALATLRFTPPPRAVRRAMVVWMDETAAP